MTLLHEGSLLVTYHQPEKSIHDTQQVHSKLFSPLTVQTASFRLLGDQATAMILDIFTPSPSLAGCVTVSKCRSCIAPHATPPHPAQSVQQQNRQTDPIVSGVHTARCYLHLPPPLCSYSALLEGRPTVAQSCLPSSLCSSFCLPDEHARNSCLRGHSIKASRGWI